MRLRTAIVTVLAALAGALCLPGAASADPDALACTAAGSYSRVIGGVPTTFWLVGTASGYRYWQVVTDAGGSDLYQRSYVTRCGSGGALLSWSDLTVTATSGDRCGTANDFGYLYVGTHSAVVPFKSWYLLNDYRYWQVRRAVISGGMIIWVYDHSELAACLA